MFAFDSRKQSCFCHICTKNVESTEVSENIMNNYVKHWKHTEINTKGKMPLASIEELESKEIKISYDGDRILDPVTEGNDVVDCSMLSITLCLYSQFNSLTPTPIIICTGDIFVVIAPLDNNKSVKY